jgi:hypothetical protein
MIGSGVIGYWAVAVGCDDWLSRWFVALRIPVQKNPDVPHKIVQALVGRRW